jgi:hypothetical protein
MKITIIDFINSRGHKNFNLKFFSLLNKNINVTIIVKKDFYSQVEKSSLKNINFIEFPFNFFDKEGAIASRIRILILMLISRLKFNIQKSDYIVILGYEIITFSIFRFLYPKFKTYLIHHQNIDEFDNYFKKLLFTSFKNLYNHITLDQFISESLYSNFQIPKNLIHFINHPISKENKLKKTNHNGKINLISLSNSNNPNDINELASIDFSGQFKNKPIKIYLKSNKNFKNTKHLTFISHYLNVNEYKFLLKKADYSLILLPPNFKNRISGVMIDSLSNHIPIIGPDVPSILYFKKRYPNLVRTFNHLKDLTNLDFYKKADNLDFNKFIQDHSNEKITSQLNKIFGIK